MSRRGLGGRVVALACVGAVISGCGSGERLEADGLTVLVGERADNGADALLSGRVENVGGCAGIEGLVVVWPHGTSVGTDGPFTIHVPGRPPAGLGDAVEVGGGMAIEAGESTGDFSVAGVTVPAACAEKGVWVATMLS